MRRMLATDLDGTLLGPDGMVSERTLRALTLAREAGLIVALVTGRPPRWLAPVIEQTGWHGLAVCANGAVLVDLESRTVEQTFPMDDATLLQVIACVRELLPGASFGVEHVQVGAHIDDEFTRHHDRFEDHVLGGTAIKLLARIPTTNDADLMLDQIQNELDGVVTVTHSTTSEVLLEICRHGITKASGVAWLAAAHGIDRLDVVAVGDMPNDLPMLLWAGQGFAMGNAHAAVRATVTHEQTLPTNAQDGVAELIYELLGRDSTPMGQT